MKEVRKYISENQRKYLTEYKKHKYMRNIDNKMFSTLFKPDKRRTENFVSENLEIDDHM